MKFIISSFLLVATHISVHSQSWQLITENIERALQDSAINTSKDPYRPGYHLTPPTGCMGDPNGGIFHQGWYHIFYGLQPFAHHPGGWYWAHARSRDLLHWEGMAPNLTPAFELGLDAIGSGSTIITDEGKKLAFYSQGKGGPMEFWRAEFITNDFSQWHHPGRNPILTLDQPGLPPYDDFWRDPFVFQLEGRTFLIATADLFDENYVPVPIFESVDKELTQWDYKGELLRMPKHRFRNLEVSEIRPLGNKWIFLASTDAPIDRVIYFIGEMDFTNLKFNIESEGVIDHSGHYYAQETMLDDDGNLILMAWIPGWDREWLPYYMNTPLKNSNLLWNGCFAIPRKLTLLNGELRQQPVESFKQLRYANFQFNPMELRVDGPATKTEVIEGFSGDQVEILVQFDLHNASFCGINVLTNPEGLGGLPITWSGDLLNVDGVMVQMENYTPGKIIEMQIFVDKKFVEIFIDGGKYCITRQVREEYVSGENIALTSLGGTARLISFNAWKLETIN